MLDDVTVGENSLNEGFKLLIKEQERLLEDINAYRMARNEHENTILEKNVAMNAITEAPVNHEIRDLSGDGEAFVDEDKRNVAFLLVADSYKQLSNVGQVDENTPPVYFRLLFNVEKAVLKYYNREVFELISFLGAVKKLEAV